MDLGRQITDLETKAPKASGGLNLRRVLGGFGIMYMRSLWGITTGGLGYGQDERLAMDEQFGMSSASLSGAGFRQYNQKRALQNKIALAGGANNPLLSLQAVRATVPFAGDIATGLGAGVGAYAFMQQMAMWGGDDSFWSAITKRGPEGGQAITIGGKQIANIRMPQLVAATTAASLLAGGIAAGQDETGIGYRFGTGNYSSALTDALGVLLGPATLKGTEEKVQTTATMQRALERGDPLGTWTNNPVKRKLFGLIPVPSMYVDTTTPEGQNWENVTEQKLFSQEYGFSNEATAATWKFLKQTGVTASFEDVAAQIQGGFSPDMVSGMLTGFGISVGTQYDKTKTGVALLGSTYVDLMGKVAPAEQPVFQSGVDFMKQLGYAPAILERQFSIFPNSADLMKQQTMEWGRYAGTIGGGIYAQQMNLWARQIAGGVSNPIQPQYVENMTPEEAQKAALDLLPSTQVEDLLDALQQQGITDLGWWPGKAQWRARTLRGKGIAAIKEAVQQQSQSVNIIGQMRGMGASISTINQMKVDLDNGSISEANLAQRLVNADPSAIALAATQDPYFNKYVTMQPSGHALFTTNLAIGTQSSMQVAQSLWGNEYDAFGIRSALETGGTRLLGYQMLEKNYANSMASVGIGAAQQQLSFAFQTGVGLSGYNPVDPRTGQAFNLSAGGFWGLQDAQRALGRRQQLYQFDFQDQQAEMQQRHFYENTALQRRGTMMQRQFARQEWGYSDELRNLQWGWRQEDYGEEVRFLTGRQRRLAERRMERDTITHGLEGDRIDRQREQQEKLWDLEDEQHNLRIKQFEEQMDMQKKNREKMREFYEEGYKLQEAMTDLQRAYFVESHKLQEAAIGLQEQQIQLQYEQQQYLMDLKTLEEDQRANVTLMWTEFSEYLEHAADSTFWEKFEKFVEDLDKAFGETPTYIPPNAPPIPYIPPSDQTPPVSFDDSTTSWNNTVVSSHRTVNQQPVVNMVIYLGNQQFTDYIVSTVEAELE